MSEPPESILTASQESAAAFAATQAFAESDLPLPNRGSGKVRDWYGLGKGLRLLVVTDRLSAFDRILANVPYKGQVLNQLSVWWFERTTDIVQNHKVSVPDPNAIVALEASPLPVEVVVRGFITGVTSTALWHRYSLGERNIYGYQLPEGLRKNDRLPVPIITPTTKGGPTGHDERLSSAEVVEHGLMPAPLWEQVQSTALALFARGQQLAETAGLVLVDTKYEFGLDQAGQLLLIDEIHTPDSSRYWRAASYAQRLGEGLEPENLDKEFVRLEYAKLGYRGDGVPPAVPASLWAAASRRYVDIYEMLTGQRFEAAAYPVNPRLIANLRQAGWLS